MDKIEQIKLAISNAENGISKLTPEVLDLPSFSSHKIKHLLNNLCGISRRYFEVGLHKCGTFISALYGNNETCGIGCDNWSEFEQNGESERIASENYLKYIMSDMNCIWHRDCFEIGGIELHNVDMFNYDGNHSYENQKRAITHFYNNLTNEFILCIDDYQWADVKNGTQEGIKEMKLEILFEKELGMETPSSEKEYWNGFYVAFLKKKV